MEIYALQYNIKPQWITNFTVVRQVSKADPVSYHSVLGKVVPYFIGIVIKIIPTTFIALW